MNNQWFQLLPYCETEAQENYVKALMEHSSQAEAARSLGVNIRSLERAIQKVRNIAKSQGDALHDINAQTRVIRDDEGRIVLYNKTKYNKTVPLYKEMQEGLSVKPAKPSKVVKGAADELCSVLTIADQHIGMLAYGIETGGDDWNTDLSVDMLMTAIDELFPKDHHVSHGVLLNLGDLLHYDKMQAVTNQSGHVLDADSRPGKIYRAGASVIRYAIDKMLKHCDTLEVMNIRGNHDESSMLWLNTLCQHVYANEPRIHIQDNDCKMLSHAWGKNFICAYHGDGLSPQKAYNQASDIFSKEFADADFVWMPSGHLHRGSSEPIGKARMEVMATLAPSDAWSSAHGYRAHREMWRTDLHPLGGKLTGKPFNPALHARILGAA